MATGETSENGQRRLLQLLAAIAQAKDRAVAIHQLSDHLGVESVLFFTTDPEVGAMLCAPGFPQTLPDGTRWEGFLKDCVQAGRHEATLPFPRNGTMKSVTGLTCDKSSVLALIGKSPPSDILDLIQTVLPLVAAAFTCEQVAAVRGAQLDLAKQIAKESTALATGLDNARRAAQGEIVSRKKAEKALRIARDELARTNAELEARVQERTQRLSKTVAELEAFSYSVSHDMRAPLRAMQGYAAVLLEDLGPKLEILEQGYLERISRSAQKLDRLIRDVLTYNRLAHGTIKLEMVDLNAVVSEVIQNYPELQEPYAEVVVELPLPSVLGHEVLVGQCVSHLMMNAVKFVATGTKARVRIWAETASGSTKLWVADNGIGVASHNQSRIFRMFQRINPEGLFEGTGIGLTTTKKAMERMGGEVGLESREGEGSQFSLKFRTPTDTSGNS